MQPAGDLAPRINNRRCCAGARSMWLVVARPTVCGKLCVAARRRVHGADIAGTRLLLVLLVSALLPQLSTTIGITTRISTDT